MFSRGAGAPATLDVNRTTERTKLALRSATKEKEREGSSPGEERWPISRYSAHMPRPTIRYSCSSTLYRIDAPRCTGRALRSNAHKCAFSRGSIDGPRAANYSNHSSSKDH